MPFSGNLGSQKWQPSDHDAFLVSVKGRAYYYAIDSDLDGLGSHYYQEDKRTKEATEVPESEIIDLVQNHSDTILKMCPCVEIENGHLKPLVVRDVNG